MTEGIERLEGLRIVIIESRRFQREELSHLALTVSCCPKSVDRYGSSTVVPVVSRLSDEAMVS
jgi:hypothetical protein